MIQKSPFLLSVIIACAMFGQAASTIAAARPCQADIEKFCADVNRGGGRIAQCLRKHYDELSTECKARGQELRDRVRDAYEACNEDVAKYCGAVRPGEGHIVTCLRRHDQQLSANCRAALEER